MTTHQADRDVFIREDNDVQHSQAPHRGGRSGDSPRARPSCSRGARAAAAANEAAATYDPDEKVTLNLAFWGNDVRAALYDEAIAAFNEEYPNITVNSSFLGFPEFWEKRQTEAAGGGLPDVMQFDYSYLRQYSENGLLLDLEPYLGNIIDTEPLAENILSIGVVDGETTGIPTSTNAWGLFTNPKLLEQVGVEEFEGGDWEDYTAWMKDVSDAGGGALWGGTDFTGRIQNFEIQQRAKGEDLFTEDGEPNFTEKDLAAFWEQGEDAARRDHPAAATRGDLPGLGLRRRTHHERADLGQLRRRLPRQPRRRATPSSASSPRP